MRMIKFEFLKIMTNRLFIFTLFILGLSNLLFLSYQNYSESKNGIPYSAYQLLIFDLAEKTHEEKGIYIREAYERANAINMIYHIQSNAKSENPTMREYANRLRDENQELYHRYYEEAKNPTWRYTGDSDKELSFLEKIKSDYDVVDHYQETLNDILEEATQLKTVSIFKSKDEVTLKGITKTANVYQNMVDTKVNYEIGEAVEKVSKVSITDFFVLILVFVISAIIITEEKEKNLFTIIKITKNGRGKTIIAKIFSLFLGVFLVSILFYGMNFLYYWVTLGYGDFLATIQSVGLFLLSVLKVNILEYLLLFFSAKCLYLFLFGLLMFYLAIKFNHANESLFVLFIFVLINFLLYRSIDVTSRINLLKSFNLINLMDTNEIFSVYDNLRFYHMITSKTKILIILQVLSVLLLITCSVIRYLRSREVIVKDNRMLSNLKKFRIRRIRLNHIFSFEAYKLLFVNGCLVMMILFALFMMINFKNQNFNLSHHELFYKNYMDILSGHLTEEKELLIQNTIKEYDQAEEQLGIIRAKTETGELSGIEAMFVSQPYEDILATKEIFGKIVTKYHYLKENPKASFVYDTGYLKLFRVNSSFNEIDVYLIVITLIVLLGLFTMEYRTGFISILNATKNGRVKTARSKVLVTLLACTFLYIVSIIPEILGTFKMYGLDNLEMSITSLEPFRNLPVDISIFAYFLTFYVVRYISYIFIIFLIEYISIKLKNIVFTFITSSLILLTPYIISSLTLSKSNVFPLMNLSIIGKNLFLIIFLPIIVMLSIFIYNRIIMRLE